MFKATQADYDRQKAEGRAEGRDEGRKAERKKNISPTVVCVSYNYETAGENAKLLAGAAMIAADDMTSGRRTVIFFNDEQNNGTGYRSVSSKYFKNSPKVIYLDYGNSSYISRSSFARNYSSIKIKFFSIFVIKIQSFSIFIIISFFFEFFCFQILLFFIIIFLQ